MRYRKEIDGLRAIAVLPVILFHAGITGFQGGFLGVDIFFVISGYLITTLILEKIEQQSFSISAFYLKRARRILPALFFVAGISIPISWFLMLPDDLENFGQSVVATVAFSNNILLNLTAGYWVQASELKPLIHTWSLGVEEQYYLLIPLLLFALYRHSLRPVAIVIAILATVSLLWSEYAASHFFSFNFYMLFSRFWELAIGGLISISMIGKPNPLPLRYQNLLATLGLVIIAISMAIFDRHIPHPGLATLPIITGTTLILYFAKADTLAARFLSIPVLTSIGIISYSAYLWHQPVFAFIRLSSLEPPDPIIMLAAIPFILLLSWVSWRFVETPCRDSNSISNRRFLQSSIGAGITLIAIGLYFHATSGLIQSWPELSDEKSSHASNSDTYNEWVKRYSTDKFPTNNQTSVLVIGKSFARDFINAGIENQYFSRHNIVYRSDFTLCDTRMSDTSAINRQLLKNSHIVVFAFRSNGFNPTCMQRLITTINAMQETDIIVIGTKNFGSNNNAVMLLPADKRYRYRAKVRADVLLANAEASAIIPSKYYVDIIQMLIDKTGRVNVFTPDEKFISQDTEHLTRAGAKYIGKIIFEHPLLRSLK